MGRIFKDTKTGSEIEVHEVVKVNFAEGYFFDENCEKYTFKEAYIAQEVAEVNKQCVIIIEQEMVFVLNKISYELQLAEYLDYGTLVEIKE